MAVGRVNVGGKYNINGYIHYSSLGSDTLMTQKTLDGFDRAIIDKHEECIWIIFDAFSANTAMRNTIVKLSIEDFSQLSFEKYSYSTNSNVIDTVYAHKYNLFVIRRTSSTRALWLVDKNDYSEIGIVSDVSGSY